MNFIVVTLFPEMFYPFWDHGIVGRAIRERKITAGAVNPREFTRDRHKTTDDRPFGGGLGMVMKPEPLAAAIRSAKKDLPDARSILLTPQGRPFDQATAVQLASQKALLLVCGRYEGVDERVGEGLIDLEISVGDYVLTGGELPAMIVMDAVTRLVPGTLGGDGSAQDDSFSDGLLEHAQYTRPRSFEGEAVPEVLCSGNHAAIENWRRESALIRTFLKRKDLLEKKGLNPEERQILKKWYRDIEQLLKSQPLSGVDSSSGGQ
jgi:tRNA (guanine37-N1)-methyltransferase